MFGSPKPINNRGALNLPAEKHKTKNMFYIRQPRQYINKWRVWRHLITGKFRLNPVLCTALFADQWNDSAPDRLLAFFRRLFFRLGI